MKNVRGRREYFIGTSAKFLIFQDEVGQVWYQPWRTCFEFMTVITQVCRLEKFQINHPDNIGR